MKRSRRPDQFCWPRSYAEGNRRRVALLKKKNPTRSEMRELYALGCMVNVWVDSRRPLGDPEKSIVIGKEESEGL